MTAADARSSTATYLTDGGALCWPCFERFQNEPAPTNQRSAALRPRSLPAISAKPAFLAIALLVVAALAGRGAYLRRVRGPIRRAS